MAQLTVISTPANVFRTRPASSFYHDVVQGLRAQQKYLDPKYFYDAAGDELFQQIMQCPEYYLTGCEMEIMTQQSAAIAAAFSKYAADYDVIELGAGDASKSIHLLQQLIDNGTDYTYYPIDISGNVIQLLNSSLPQQLPQLSFRGLQGEYFEMLKYASTISSRRKILLFMGGNIGNFSPAAARSFCQQLRQHLQSGDLLLTGFDLKKHPQLILHAYNDSAGITREFNFNLLRRINRELQADFDTSKFEHFPTYDPQSGSCKSYLISLCAQQVHIGDDVTIPFRENEPIYMEISQKYDPVEINQLAAFGGFAPVAEFRDQRNWFSDCLWQAV
ncbi:L-histidine N(alpha)-methyltransferase [Chitinophaga sp. Cy-1792]|uniref:L-histidine N(alpha)-methyltransferase n=1 Tax=Chitinophaga sp. Cy-1792 TaxID=2608339 RepID=UPI00141E4474|nr:L-histidine N(alpha)-methyltransferase [Chitinophaga sp. Cy-1792]NIG54355.1 L-histidine N(alpha)-methyltransferase [Chitinophaga sp. Cy-1792]